MTNTQQKSKKQKVWEKAHSIRGKNPDQYRRDAEGNVIRHASYGTLGKFGWEIDHKIPKSKGGSDAENNLRALHWEANREKGDKRK